MRFGKKQIGMYGECIAKDYYIKNGFDFIDKNYYIRGGEIDLIMKKGNKYFFLEVKTIDNVDNIYGYITKNKLIFLKKTLDYYLIKNKISDYQIDIVFVKNGYVFDIFENIYLDK